jgi:hypothetical protein
VHPMTAEETGRPGATLLESWRSTPSSVLRWRLAGQQSRAARKTGKGYSRVDGKLKKKGSDTRHSGSSARHRACTAARQRVVHREDAAAQRGRPCAHAQTKHGSEGRQGNAATD